MPMSDSAATAPPSHHVSELFDGYEISPTVVTASLGDRPDEMQLPPAHMLAHAEVAAALDPNPNPNPNPDPKPDPNPDPDLTLTLPLNLTLTVTLTRTRRRASPSRCTWTRCRASQR